MANGVNANAEISEALSRAQTTEEVNKMTSIEFKGICKYFPGVKALENISFVAESGSVYAFLGENGAGKSTLLKILNGDYHPDEGAIFINKQEKHFYAPKDAILNGISVIYQERQVLKEMTVAENVFLGDWPRNAAGKIDFAAMNKKTDEIAARFGLDIKADSKVGTLSIALQQMVEIMFCSSRDEDLADYGEIVSIYLLEEYWGKGLGKALMSFALEKMQENNCRNYLLWAFKENARAIRFYEKFGFTADGTEKVSAFSNQAIEVRYRLDLGTGR